MTASEKLFALFLIVSIVFYLLTPAWWVSLIFLGLAVLLLATGLGKLESDPLQMGLIQGVGGVLTRRLIRGPRYVIASKILGEDVIPVPKKEFNWDFFFPEVECNLVDTPPDGPATDFVGGGGFVDVKISYTGGVVPDGKHAYEYVRQEREGGVRDQFNDRLEEVTRKHGTYTSWQTFVGQKRDVFPELLNGKMATMVAGLGLDPNGRFNVKAIDPAGKLKEVVANRAVENQQRASEALDTSTRVANANRILDAARARGDMTMSFKDALEIDRIDSERAREIILRTGDKDKVLGPIVGSALRDVPVDAQHRQDKVSTHSPQSDTGEDHHVDDGHHE